MLVYIIISIFVSNFCIIPKENLEKSFQDFIKKYKKHYKTPSEYLKRFEIFKSNLKKIKILQKTVTHGLGITKFTDMTEAEIFPNPLPDFAEYDDTYIENLHIKDVPEEFDYRKTGNVCPVQNQGACGSCFIFASVGVIESIYKEKHGNLLKFSEKYILDCDSESSCNGGSLDTVYNFVNKTGYLYEAKDYKKYDAKKDDSDCPKKTEKAHDIKFKGWKAVNFTDNVEKMKEHLYTNGPSYMGVNATGMLLNHYTHGIIEVDNCPKNYTESDHGVLVVGWGKEKDTPYWIVKNSWGDDWGEDGYFRVKMGLDICRCESKIKFLLWDKKK